MQIGEKRRSRGNDDMFFINDSEEDLIVERDSDQDIL